MDLAELVGKKESKTTSMYEQNFPTSAPAAEDDEEQIYLELTDLHSFSLCL